MFGLIETIKNHFFFYLKDINLFQLYQRNLTLQDETIRYLQRHLGAENKNGGSLAIESQGPDIKKIVSGLIS